MISECLSNLKRICTNKQRFCEEQKRNVYENREITAK